MIESFGHTTPREATELCTRALRGVDAVEPFSVREMITRLLRANRERFEVLERKRGNVAGALWGEPINDVLGLATAIVDAEPDGTGARG